MRTFVSDWVVVWVPLHERFLVFWVVPHFSHAFLIIEGIHKVALGRFHWETLRVALAKFSWSIVATRVDI